MPHECGSVRCHSERRAPQAPSLGMTNSICARRLWLGRISRHHHCIGNGFTRGHSSSKRVAICKRRPVASSHNERCSCSCMSSRGWNRCRLTRAKWCRGRRTGDECSNSDDRTAPAIPCIASLGPASSGLGAYCDCITFAGFKRAARAAGIVVARNVIAVISSVAIARITGSEARIAYTRLEMTWPEK